MINSIFINNKFKIIFINILGLEYLKKIFFENLLLNLTKSASIFLEKYIVESVFINVKNITNLSFNKMGGKSFLFKKLIPMAYLVITISIFW